MARPRHVIFNNKTIHDDTEIFYDLSMHPHKYAAAF